MNNTAADYYNILNIPRDASEEDIKKSFRVLAHRFHPDKNPGDIESEENFKNISKAYEVLGDPQKKAIYDRTGSDNFSNIFGSRGGMQSGGMGCGRKRGCGGRQRAGSNFEIHEIALTRKEALAGAAINIGIDKGGQKEMHKINLPGEIENGTVLRYSNSSIGADFFIRVVYSDK